jgi:outer membrane protein
MKKSLFKAGIGLAITTIGLLGSNQTLSIDGAIKIALKHSPDIKISRFDFEQSKQRNKFQKGYYLPRVDLAASAGKQGMDYKANDDFEGNILLGNLSASQLIYDFGKTRGAILASNEESNAYEASLNQFIAKKILLVKSHYYEVLKVKSFIDVNQKNITLQEAQLKRAQRYYEKGIKTIIDVSDAKVRLDQAKLELNNSEYELKLRRAILEQTMGYVPNQGKYTLRYHTISLPHVTQHLPRINTSMNMLEPHAYENRYELKYYQHLEQRTTHALESQQGSYYPTLAFNGDYTVQDIEGELAGSVPNKQWGATVDLTWNLFSGNQTDANVQEAKIAKLKAASQLDDARLLIKREVLEASLGLQRSYDSVMLSESIAGSSKQKFEQVQKRYENDLADYIELQEAQQGYIRSLADLVNTYYDYYIAIAQLDFAIGR